MATVADIEPASLTVTPGTAEQFTLTLRNEGEEVEEYRLTALGDAAEHLVIEPDTLIVQPGETGTATATMHLEGPGDWTAGELAVRFQVVPTDRPDEVLVLGATATIAAITSPGGVTAVLSPPAIEGRRSAATRIALANAGSAEATADVAVSASDLEVTIDRPSVTVPAGSSEEVGLRVRSRGLRLRGDPVHHDFIVTVTPAGQPATTLEGTFRQSPILPGRTFAGAIIAACAIGLVVTIALAVLAWNGLAGMAKPVAMTATATPTATPVPEPVSVVTELASSSDPDPTDDVVVATVAVDAADAPDDSLVAVAVSWPDPLALAGDSCLGWVDPATDELRESDAPGLVRSGDQCLIDPGTLRAQADLQFTIPAQGFTGTVSATSRRLVTVDEDTVADVEPRIRTNPAQPLEVTTEPPPFWMEVEAYRPDPESSTRQFVVAVHRTLDASARDAQFSFRITTPEFADPPDLYGAWLQSGAPACVSVPEDDVCVVDFPVDVDPADQGSGRWVGGALEAQWIFVTLQVPTDETTAGLVSLEATGLTEGDETLGEDQLAALVAPATGPLVLGADAFPVDVMFDPSTAAPGDEVRAMVKLDAAIFDDRTAAEDGSRLIQVAFDWSDGIDLAGDPIGCESYDGSDRVCTLDASAAAGPHDIELTFAVADDAGFDGSDHADLLAKASVLTYPPDDERDVTGGADVPGGWPIRWFASEIQPLEYE